MTTITPNHQNQSDHQNQSYQTQHHDHQNHCNHHLSEQVLNVLNTFNYYQLDELYRILKARKEDEDSGEYPSIHDKLHELTEKYFNLVWYARKYPEDRKIPGVDEAMKDVEKKYPKELKSLRDIPDWTHGFNSGILAASRLLHAYALDSDWTELISDDEDDIIITRDTEIELAEDMFPCLDT